MGGVGIMIHFMVLQTKCGCRKYLPREFDESPCYTYKEWRVALRPKDDPLPISDDSFEPYAADSYRVFECRLRSEVAAVATYWIYEEA